VGQQPPPPPSHSATALLEAVALRYSITPPLKGSQWGGGFSHLCHYGGGYYTYAVAAVVSAALWERLFAGGRASSRASGELLVRELLVHGGGRDARELLRACLGGAGVQAVGPQALMQEVWAGAQPGRLQGR
jgi:Zn-dependent oligopeptidase